MLIRVPFGIASLAAMSDGISLPVISNEKSCIKPVTPGPLIDASFVTDLHPSAIGRSRGASAVSSTAHCTHLPTVSIYIGSCPVTINNSRMYRNQGRRNQKHKTTRSCCTPRMLPLLRTTSPTLTKYYQVAKRTAARADPPHGQARRHHHGQGLDARDRAGRVRRPRRDPRRGRLRGRSGGWSEALARLLSV